ncbi:hypothetical protein LTR16_006244, partial [Cryomyces antarcticus]
MEQSDHHSGDENGFGDEPPSRPRRLPDDLPKSLDDRRSFPSYSGETEIYDAWQ